jgi:hypothetical protein
MRHISTPAVAEILMASSRLGTDIIFQRILCFSIYNPAEFAKYDHKNTSMIEQWHAIMDALTMTVKGSTLAHAMFLLQTLQDDHYIYMCNKNKYPEAKRSW